MALKPLDCTQLREVMAKIARYHMSQPGVKTADDVVALVKSHFPKEQADIITRDEVIDSIMSFAKKKAKSTKTAIQTQAANIMKEAKLDRATRERIDKLQKSLAGLPENPSTKKERGAVVEAVRTLRSVEADLRKRKGELERANPEQNRQRIVKAISARVTKGGDVAGIRPLVQRLARDHVADAQTRDELIDLVHADIADVVPSGWTRRETMDAISGYGEFKGLNKEEMAAKLRDLKGQMQQVGKMDDMANGMPPRKTGGERRVPSDEERRLIQQVNDMKKELGIQTTDPETQLKSALDSIKTNLKNKIADLTGQINKQQRTKRVIKRVPRDPEALALEATRDRLKEQLDDIVGPDLDAKRQRLQTRIAKLNAKIAARGTKSKPKEQGPKEELESHADSLKSTLGEMRRIDRMLKAIADMKQELLTGDYRRPKKRKAESDSLARLRFEYNDQRKKINDKIKLEDKTWRDVVMNVARLPGSLMKTVMTTFDISYSLRQGVSILLTGRFKVWARGFMAQFKHLTEQRFQEHFDSIFQRKNGLIYKRAGLELSQHSEEFESRIGRALRKYGPLGLPDRAFAAAGNQMRADLFDVMYESMPNASEAEAKHIASIINDMTLRSTSNKTVAAAANEFLFSYRAMKARLRVLTFAPIWTAPTGRAALMGFRQYIRALTGVGALWLFAWMLGIQGSIDPRSSDFLKIKLGETRIDPWAGLSQYATFVARMRTGETVNSKGQVKSLVETRVGERNSDDVMWDFIKGKASPALSLGIEVANRKEYGGAPFDIRRAILNRSVPLSIQDSYELFKEEGVSIGAAKSLLALLGLGVNHYGGQFGQGEALPNDIIELFGGTPNKLKKKMPRRR